MRRTKIVATLGPASSGPEVLARLIQSGMDVARLNFSHGGHEEHRERVRQVRETSERLGVSVACLQDLSGPKIRTGRLGQGEGVLLTEGEGFTLTTESVVGTAERVSTTYQWLPRDVRRGHRILLDDGLIELEVSAVEGNEVRTRVVNGGLLKSNKGINLPGVPLSTPALTEKDREDLAFGLSLDVDYVALSFVRRREDVMELRELLSAQGRPDLPVIAKIEKPEAVDNLASILAVADGVMVARGDLGVEVPTEHVPTLQKEIIRQANQAGRVVITATQMLESMVEHPRPTRAEASDVANAILDGTDAVMLSAETATGAYPVEAVATMGRIAGFTERQLFRPGGARQRRRSDLAAAGGSTVARAVAMASCGAAEQLDARCIVAFTESGATARLVSHFRPAVPVIAFTPSERVRRQLALAWGVKPLHSPHYETTDEMLSAGLSNLEASGLVSAGDTVILVCGTTALSGATNMMKVHRF
jgi:pyruvate kinase